MALGALLLEAENYAFWVALGCLAEHNALKQHALIRGLQLDVSLAVAWAYLGKVLSNVFLRILFSFLLSLPCFHFWAFYTISIARLTKCFTQFMYQLMGKKLLVGNLIKISESLMEANNMLPCHGHVTW